MKPSEAMDLHREFIRKTCASYGLGQPRVFGSVAKGTDTEVSDLDILVEAGGSTSLFCLNGAANEISDKLGVPVDICTKAMLKKALLTEILATSILI